MLHLYQLNTNKSKSQSILKGSEGTDVITLSSYMQYAIKFNNRTTKMECT